MTQPGYVPAPQGPAGSNLADTISWMRRVVDVVNGCLAGKLNVTVTVTFTTGAGSTTITDPRISAFSHLLLMPLTANAAAILPSAFVTSQQNGEATFAHSNTIETGLTFRLLILG